MHVLLSPLPSSNPYFFSWLLSLFLFNVFFLLYPPFCLVIPTVSGSQLGRVCLQETLGNVWRQSWLSRLGEEVFWHLVGQGQGCCSTLYSAQDGPTAENGPAPDTNSTKAEKPCDQVIPGHGPSMTSGKFPRLSRP